jgi:citrate lyase subunit beta/citryl-CoA lyase
VTARTPRSLLFAPGDDPRKLVKAIAAGAALAVADLEDAVAEERKVGARATVAQALVSRKPDGGRCAVRINELDGPYGADDLRVAVEAGADAIVVPKASAAALGALAVGDLPPVIAIIETAIGLQESAAIAATPGVSGLILGAVDLGLELRLTRRVDGLELVFARSKLVMDSAAAGIGPPIDVVHVDLDAPDALRDECLLARSLGFGGKACIHPKQIPIVEAAFGPTEAQVDGARRIVREFEAALARGAGVVAIDGQMVDRPGYERALDLINDDTRTTA